MATLVLDSYQEFPEGRSVLDKARETLRKLTQMPKEEVRFQSPPNLLLRIRHQLDINYPLTWRSVQIKYNDDLSGARIHRVTKVMELGRLLSEARFRILEFEKIILHEFLHVAMKNIPNSGDRHMDDQLAHNDIDQLLAQMGYRPPLNPGKGI